MDNYLPYLSGRGDVELAYLARTSPKAVAARDRFGGTVLESWDDLTAFDADIAFNLTTDTAHADVLDQLVRSGTARIFAEKPLVAGRGQEWIGEDDFVRAVTIAAAARTAGVEIAMGFNYRFFDTVRESLGMVSDAAIGDISAVVASAHYACWSHTIDLIGAACGPASVVSAVAGERPADGIPPTRAVSFTTVSGVVGTLSGTARRAWDDELFSIAFLGERGHVQVSDLDVATESFVAATGRRTTTRLGAAVSRDRTYAASFVASVAAYLDAVGRGEPAPVGLDAGLRELQVEAAIARSISTGRAVHVQSEFPLAAS